jgi:hypothetical protein
MAHLLSKLKLNDKPTIKQAFPHKDIIDLQAYKALIDEGTSHQGISGLLGLNTRKR